METIAHIPQVAEIATPPNPAAGHRKLYPKADGKIYTLDSSGVESLVWPYETIFVDQSRTCKADLPPTNTNVNADLDFGALTESDAGWSHAAGTNEFTWTGAAEKVTITVSVKQEIPGNVNRQRPSPILELYLSLIHI